MAASEDLYALIASLSKSEKRYCTMMLEAGTGRKAHTCLRLFEILCAMRRPDETAVRDAVAAESFASHLPVAKNHLYEHLLRSLRTLGAARGAKARVRALIEGAEVLCDRSMPRPARERLRDARELAERLGYLPEQLIIARLEWRIDAHIGYRGSSLEILAERRARITTITHDVENYWDHLHLFASVSCALIQHGPHDTDDRRVLGPLMNVPPPTTFPAKRYNMEALRLHYMMTGCFAQGYEHSLRHLAFADSFPERERLEQFNVLALLHNHVMVSLKTGRNEEARATAERLGELRPASRADRVHVAPIQFCCRLELLMVDLDVDAIAAMAGELEELCRANDNGFARQLPLGYAIDLAFSAFAHGRLDAAIETLHPVINAYRPGFRDDALCIARLLQLMIHYDRGDIELLPYLIRSTYRFISRCRGISEVDRTVLRFMRRLPNIATQEELLAAFVRVREELAAIAVNPAEQEASAMSCISPWLDSKITGRSLLETALAERRALVVDETQPSEAAALETTALETAPTHDAAAEREGASRLRSPRPHDRQYPAARHSR